MTETPSPESLALVDHIFLAGLNAKGRADCARRIDAHVAERTAELRKIISDQSDAHVAHMKSVDEANERRLDAYKARLDTLRAAADAMAVTSPMTNAELLDALRDQPNETRFALSYEEALSLISDFRASVTQQHPNGGMWRIDQRVTKRKGSSWTGCIVGFYVTAQTPIGYAVESENEPGSVQIYPEAALSALPTTEPEHG